jgi:predicted nuclease of restriction endonuclease-like RecB superfamily
MKKVKGWRMQNQVKIEKQDYSIDYHSRRDYFHGAHRFGG